MKHLRWETFIVIHISTSQQVRPGMGRKASFKIRNPYSSIGATYSRTSARQIANGSCNLSVMIRHGAILAFEIRLSIRGRGCCKRSTSLRGRFILLPRSLSCNVNSISLQKDTLMGTLFSDQKPLQLVYPKREMSQRPSRSKQQLHAEWTAIVGDYWGSRLTVDSDRVPAISGIAQDFSNVFKSQGIAARYLAGLWDSFLIYNLL